MVLLHGNLSTIGVDFGGIIPSLAKNRQVIGVEQQAHGHTADIDRPLSVQNWTSDTVRPAAPPGDRAGRPVRLQLGSAVAMQLTLDHPELVGKLVLASAATGWTGCTRAPGGRLRGQPEHLAGTPFDGTTPGSRPTPATGRG